jgi:hypothetical protein
MQIPANGSVAQWLEYGIAVHSAIHPMVVGSIPTAPSTFLAPPFFFFFQLLQPQQRPSIFTYDKPYSSILVVRSMMPRCPAM